ncbi:hypothetical protein RchiOBHm_Chr3g0491381 [Rosa chinensis]|uniref:Uncharacterized protein n=1 Tax=Rosa chinensis TaxID=74649 RepID=A0A2P6RGA0_ROSCH|nr:hypothetical protein RchiOBHm_Chr3g0491381 [Rosa chinensis]
MTGRSRIYNYGVIYIDFHVCKIRGVTPANRTTRPEKTPPKTHLLRRLPSTPTTADHTQQRRTTTPPTHPAPDTPAPDKDQHHSTQTGTTVSKAANLKQGRGESTTMFLPPPPRRHQIPVRQQPPCIGETRGPRQSRGAAATIYSLM